MTENLDNDEANDPIGPHDSDNGEPPHLIHEANLPIFIPRPSGNMVRIKCPAAGELIKLQLTNNSSDNGNHLKINLLPRCRSDSMKLIACSLFYM